MSDPTTPRSRHLSKTEQRTWIGIGIGVAAAAIGTAAGIAANQLRKTTTTDSDPAQTSGTVDVAAAERAPIGSLTGHVVSVPTRYGTPLHAEIDEPESWQPGDLTIVFSHGYALSHVSWHFQREHFRDTHRMVFWDQRGHGQSEHCAADPTTIDTLGDDLAAVIEATTPTGPIVLVGHSMGGMTVMAYTERHHQEFAERVVGVGLVATSAGGLDTHDFGWGPAGPVLQNAAPVVLNSVAKYAKVTEKARKNLRLVESTLVKRYSYAAPVSAAVANLTPALIANTSLEVLNDFLPAFKAHDKANVLASLAGVETLVLVGENDLMTPPEHSERIITDAPHAEFVRIPRAGHMVMLEYPGLVNNRLADLFKRALRSAAALPTATTPSIATADADLREVPSHTPEIS